IEVHHASLPGRIGKKLRRALRKPDAGVRYDQLHALQAALLQVLQKARPAGLVLLRPFHDAEDLAIALTVDTNRHQQRHIANLARPAALHHDAVQIDVRVLARDRPTAPRVDGRVDPFVEVRYCRRRYPRAPQRLGDVLDPAHRYASQIHLDQRLLDRGLATPVALDDRRLERLATKLRHLELHLAGLGLEVALVVARPGVATRLGSLVALRIAQPAGFRDRKRVV